jgi:pimeloyl-ACP methyl ester carboxylesterase
MNCRRYALCSCVVFILSTVATAQIVSHLEANKLAAPPPALPAPSGAYFVGREGFDLVDTARADPFSAGTAKHRELMVYVWYPVRRSDGQPRGEYVPGASQLENDPAAKREVQNEFGPRWPLILSGAITSHAISGAPPAVAVPAKFPVVLFSHGISDTTFSDTAQIEDLVSHGYVVAAIEHTDAAGAVLFPGGRIRLYRDAPPPSSPPNDPLQAMIASAKQGTQTGAEDIRFVLDQLTDGTIPLVRIMDLKRVAAVGHSYGGTLTARACQLDPRIKACISEDGEVNPVGVYFDYLDHATFSQPFLFVEVDRHPTDDLLARMGESRTQWNEYLAHERQELNSCPVGSYHVVLSGIGMTHASFSDGLLLSATSGSTEATVALQNLLLTEELDRSFLDKNLKNQPAPLLDLAANTPSGVMVEHIGK